MHKFFLKRLSLIIVGLVVTTSVHAAGGLDNRVELAKNILGQIMVSPDQSIPQELLAKCKAIAIYPHVIKGAFIFGGRFGQGVVLRRDPKTGEWGAPAFSTIGGANWGLQIGGQATDLILVIMNDRGLDALLNSKFTLGADASVAAGPLGRTSSGGTDLSLSASIVTYSRSYGLFAGVSLDGAVVTQDNRSNTEYYGKPITSYEVLSASSPVTAPQSGQDLAATLNDYSSRWYKNPPSNNKDTPQVKKYDYEGEIIDIDYKKGEITLLDLGPAESKPKNAAATKKISVDLNTISHFRLKDHVKVIFKDNGKNNSVQRIVKV